MVRRFLKERGSQADRTADEPAATSAQLTRALNYVVNYELHRRKTLWADASLVYMLAQTTLEVAGDDLRAPSPSFAFVYTDRHPLSLAERMLADDAKCPWTGNSRGSRQTKKPTALRAAPATPPALRRRGRIRRDGPGFGVQDR